MTKLMIKKYIHYNLDIKNINTKNKSNIHNLQCRNQQNNQQHSSSSNQATHMNNSRMQETYKNRCNN